MEGLPLVPGYTFHNATIHQYMLPQKFGFSNGHRVVRDSNIGIGDRPTDAASLAYAEDVDTIRYDPSLTYGRVREYGYQQFVPHYALFAQKCLCFKAFFRQGVFASPDEHFRIRYVNIIYFLEDDTLTVMEPPTDNAGFQQGKLVGRGRIVKNTAGDVFHWKDFNVGANVCIYGVVYHIVDCDLFTREFLSSQGIDVGDREHSPVDPYMESRTSKNKSPTRLTKIPDDPRRRFLEYDKMVLQFDATWNEDIYQIVYFLTDDTIAIREIRKPNSGKDPATMLLKRMRVPKDWKNLPSSYPGIYLEYGEPEVREYYTPKDFKIGDTVFIFGRRFFLYGCDAFTRKYYKDMLCIQQPENVRLPVKDEKPATTYVAPPHIKFGTPEDTYASCLSFVPKPPRKNLIRQLSNFPKKLRYSMRMDAVHPEDEDREFTLEYNLSDGTLLINELEKRNSGRRGGLFLSPMLVPKPGSDRDDPEYYTPNDFYVGAKINAFNHYFVINGADLFVYRYIEANPEKFSRDVRDNVRNHFVQLGLLQDDVTKQAEKITKDQGRLKEDTPASDCAMYKDDFNIDSCVRDIQADARKQYEGEHGELRPPTPPPEELCPGLTKVDEFKPTEPTNESRDEERHASTPKKEVNWADQIEHDDKGHPIVSCAPVHRDCRPDGPAECTPPRYFAHRDQRFDVQQLMYDRGNTQ